MNKQEVRNNFRDVIITDLGEEIISNTQKYRVLLVRDDDTGKARISIQKWWRESADKEWVAGKGFKLNGRQSLNLGKMLQEAGKSILHVK